MNLNFTKKALIILLLVSANMFGFAATTIYLSSTGNDNNDGLTSSTSVAHFSVAQTKATSGDIIQVSGMIDFSTDPANTASPQLGIVLLKNLTIQGTSATTDGFDGKNLTRFIQANNSSYTLTLKNLKLYRGVYLHTTTIDGGGALVVDGSTLIGENLVFDSNSTSGNIANAGSAIRVRTTKGLSFKNCTFSNNTSIKSGAIYINNANYADVTYRFEGCSFISNTAQASIGGAAVFLKNDATSTGLKVYFINCTVAKNNVGAAVDGGAIYLWAGLSDTEVNIVNCTISENTTAGTAGHGAGVRFLRTATGQFLGKLNIQNSIIENNYSTQTGKPYSDLSITSVAPTSTTLMIHNSIIGRNASLTVPAECYPGDNFFNYLSSTSTSTDLKAKLAAFDDVNKTYFLLSNSPAVNYGDAQYLQALNISNDQLGNTRTFTDNKCFAGAVEAISENVVTPTVTVTPVRTYVYNGMPQGPTEASNNGTGTSYIFSYSGSGSTNYGPSTSLPIEAGTYTATATVAAYKNFSTATSQPTPFIIFAKDPLTMYLNSVPTVSEVISSTDSGTGVSAITTKRFTFKSKDGVNTIYAIMAYPQAAGVYPAILMFHGGGGTAEGFVNQIQTYAALGYVGMCLDEPSIASVTNSSPYSTGPWKSAPAGEAPRLNVAGGVQNSTLYDAITGCIEAFNLLSSQPNVDAGKMAVTGSSWGGYLTTFTSGLLGNRVKAAYSTWGCGFYETGSFWSELIASMPDYYKTDWLNYLDAGRRAKDITAPYFIDQATNDTYFWPEAVTATLNAIPGTKNHVTMANLNHTLLPSSASMKQLYMDYYLKGIGYPFGSIDITSTETQSDGSLTVTMKPTLPNGVSLSSVQIYYSVPTATWQTRNWVQIPATLVSGTTYQASLSDALVKQGVDYYANMIDIRQIQTSSAMNKTSNTLTGLNSYRSEIEIFPNPSSAIFNFKKNNNSPSEIYAYNLAGSLVMHNTISGSMNQVINMSNYKDGVYILKVKDNDCSYLYRIIKSN